MNTNVSEKPVIGKNIPGKVFYVLSVRRVDRVPMLERDRKAADEWLKQWTPKNNFKAVITNSLLDAVWAFRDEFKKTCDSVGYPPGNFEFTIGESSLETIDGRIRFWHNHETCSVVGHNINAGGLE